MNAIEIDILADYDGDPEAWAVREWKDGTVRADSRGVTIVSGPEFDRALMRINPDKISANSGAVKFGPKFAVEWDRRVRAKLTKAQETEREVAITRDRAILVDRFGSAK